MLGVKLTVKGRTKSIPKNAILLNHTGAGNDNKNITIITAVVLLRILLCNCATRFPSPINTSYMREIK